MAYKTIILFLLSIFFQNQCFSQQDTLDLLGDLQKKVDLIVINAIQQEAFPGCVVYASHKGNPILLKSYGHKTYDSLDAVYTSDLFDMASVTKVMASTLALMKLYDDGLIDLDEPLNNYVDGLGWRKVSKVTLRQCLAHQAGLQSWIKFYEEIRKNSGRYKGHTISSSQSEDYPYMVADGMYLHHAFYKRIKQYIRKAPVNKEPHYVYSGLFFYLVPEIVQRLTRMPFETYLQEMFFQPMGLSTLTFNPMEKFALDRIVPTEIDSFFRYEPIHGRVHDEGAILMRGVSGNAGLFGAVEDVATLWQMLLDNGRLNDEQYLTPATVDHFTSCQYSNKGNRRGLGFDKPLLEYDSLISSVAKSASFESYGHTGYTGTLVWADPANDLLFVFLSNRVYPSRESKAIYQLNVRPDIHQALYDYLAQRRDNCD